MACVADSWALSFTYTAMVDTAAPTNVIGSCVSSFTGASPGGLLFRVDWHDRGCSLRKQGSTVDSNTWDPWLWTGDVAGYSWTSRTLSDPKQMGCIYCTYNRDKFLRQNTDNTQTTISEANKKDCAPAEGSGGSGGEN